MISDQALAGFLVVGRVRRQEWFDAGVTAEEVVTVSECIADRVGVDEVGWDHWFADAESARAARAAAGRPDLQVLEVGFAVEDVPELLEDISAGGWDAGVGTLPERLARREPFRGSGAGRALGFELVGFGYGTCHTWLCLGGLVDGVVEGTGVRPGEIGLVRDENQARRAAQWLTESDLGAPKVYFWVPAFLVDVDE